MFSPDPEQADLNPAHLERQLQRPDHQGPDAERIRQLRADSRSVLSGASTATEEGSCCGCGSSQQATVTQSISRDLQLRVAVEMRRSTHASAAELNPCQQPLARASSRNHRGDAAGLPRTTAAQIPAPQTTATAPPLGSFWTAINATSITCAAMSHASDYVRDRSVADLQPPRDDAGHGRQGTSWVVKFIGLDRFTGLDKTFTFNTDQTATSDEQRRNSHLPARPRGLRVDTSSARSST